MGVLLTWQDDKSQEVEHEKNDLHLYENQWRGDDSEDGKVKGLLELLGVHFHYWGVPKKNESGRWILPCFGCGREKPLKVNLEVQR
jgi:hypothetical protein